MKLIILSLALIFTAGCSSADKKQAMDAAEKEQTKVMEKVDSAKKDAAQMTKTSDASSSVLCKLSKEERKVDIIKTDKGCEVLYTKAGEKKSLANSSHGITYCEKVAKNIQSNLESAGFTCN